MELALMEGGHSVDHYKKPGKMQFMKELQEARLIRSTSDLRRMSYSELCENLYLVVLTLDFLSRFKSTRSLAGQYARQTAAYTNYKEFRISANDLYNMIHFIDANPDEVEKIFGKDAEALRKQLHLPIMALNGWLISLEGTSSRDASFLIRLEQQLKVYNPDYKDLRRYLSSSTINSADIAKIKNKLLYYFRAKLNQLDLTPQLEAALARDLS